MAPARAPPPGPAAEQGEVGRDDQAQQDPLVRGETFREHWHQLRGIATTDVRNKPLWAAYLTLFSQDVPSADDLVAVVNLLSQMTTLLQLELEAAERMASLATEEATLQLDRDPLDSLVEPVLPCLDLLLTDNILFHVLATSRMPIEDGHADQLRLQQLRLYETLLRWPTQCRTLLAHGPFLKPMLELLNHYAEAEDGGGNNNKPVKRSSKAAASGVATEKMDLHLVLLLSRLCGALADNTDLLVHFFRPDADQQECFQVLALLLRHLHREGPVGQAARDALLRCMVLSRHNEAVADYVAAKSDFCHVSQFVEIFGVQRGIKNFSVFDNSS